MNISEIKLGESEFIITDFVENRKDELIDLMRENGIAYENIIRGHLRYTRKSQFRVRNYKTSFADLDTYSFPPFNNLPKFTMTEFLDYFSNKIDITKPFIVHVSSENESVEVLAILRDNNIRWLSGKNIAPNRDLMWYTYGINTCYAVNVMGSVEDTVETIVCYGNIEWFQKEYPDIKITPAKDFIKQFKKQEMNPEKIYQVEESFIKLAHQAACREWKNKLEKKFPEIFLFTVNVGDRLIYNENNFKTEYEYIVARAGSDSYVLISLINGNYWLPPCNYPSGKDIPIKELTGRSKANLFTKK